MSEQGTTTTSNSTNNQTATTEQPRTFTQEDLNRIGSREKKEGRETATKELLESLGVDKIEDAKAILEAHRKAEQSALSDTEKAKQEAERKSAEATEQAKAATLERFHAKVERKLIRAGLIDDEKGQRLEKALRLLDLAEDADDDTIAEAVEALKEDVPSYFEPKDDKGEPRPKSSDPGRQPGKPGTASPKDRARSTLERRHPQIMNKP